MTAVDLRKITRDAKAFAKARGHAAEADDFAQEAALALWRGRKATYEQLLIDYMRKERGKLGSNRHTALCKTVSLDAPAGEETDTLLHELVAEPVPDQSEGVPEDPDRREDLLDALEVAGCLRGRRARRHARLALALDELLVPYQRDQERSRLEVEWIRFGRSLFARRRAGTEERSGWAGLVVDWIAI